MATWSTLNYMMRSCLIGILLNPALLAAQLCASTYTNVYSVNIVSIHFMGQHSAGPTYEHIWSAGPFAVTEMKYWTDVSGRLIDYDPSRTDKTGDTQHSDTLIQIGPVSFSVPLSARRTGSIGIIIGTFLLSYSFILVVRWAKTRKRSTS